VGISISPCFDLAPSWKVPSSRDSARLVKGEKDQDKRNDKACFCSTERSARGSRPFVDQDASCDNDKNAQNKGCCADMIAFATINCTFSRHRRREIMMDSRHEAGSEDCSDQDVHQEEEFFRLSPGHGYDEPISTLMLMMPLPARAMR